METVRRKKLTKTFQFIEISSTTNGMNALYDFYADHPFVDW